ncbi:MAG: hypothetical protein GY777_07205 [Candidatus Brocadiaceae bacterium]|nr:hypothetical protein [Candidatus Brocadiaceae bacterium]
MGFDKVHHIKAKKSIEDWFLLDIKGLCNVLKIKQPKTLKGNTGYLKIKNLFKQGNRTYQKGYNVNSFVDRLDYKQILSCLKNEFEELREKM